MMTFGQTRVIVVSGFPYGETNSSGHAADQAQD